MNEPKKKFKLVTDTQARMILPNTLTLIGVCVGLSSINFALNQRYEIAIRKRHRDSCDQTHRKDKFVD